MIRLNKKFRTFSGSPSAELVLIMPIFILLIGGIFEASRIFYLQNSLWNASKEAARIGSSIKESVDSNFMSKTTISKSEIESLIKNSVRVNGVIEEPEQFTIRYFNTAGDELQVQGNDLPFDRSNDPVNSVDFVEVEITYPGTGSNVNTPIPAVFNPGNIFQSNITLTAKSIFKIEGRLER